LLVNAIEANGVTDDDVDYDGDHRRNGEQRPVPGSKF
jgi:hypothetical protein